MSMRLNNREKPSDVLILGFTITSNTSPFCSEVKANFPGHAYKQYNDVIGPAWKIFAATGHDLVTYEAKSYEVKSIEFVL
jgi:hypothetical protein